MTRRTNIMLPSRLYHGTSTAQLDRMLDEGIRPHSSDSLGCWPDEVSMRGHTYLPQAGNKYDGPIARIMSARAN